jgi:hypothetical protein
MTTTDMHPEEQHHAPAGEMNTWTKLILTSILASLIPVAGFFIAYGGSIRQIEIDSKRIDQHIEVFTPAAMSRITTLEARVAVVESQATAVQQALGEIKAQNSEIIKYLMRQSVTSTHK